MRLAAGSLALALLASCVTAAQESAPAALVAKLRSPYATYEDWEPILAAGKAAVPELEKLLADAGDPAKAAAAVLLYRLGKPAALEALDGLLDSKDAAARSEAAAALGAFVGGPALANAAAGQDAWAGRMSAWRSWWKANRDKALAAPPLGALYATVLGAEEETGLAALSLAGRHGAQRGMQLNVRRGEQFVCLLEIVFADMKGSVGRIVRLSARVAPAPGDRCFWTKPQGE